MILQLEIQELHITHHKKYITYKEYLKIAKETVVLNDDEVNASLIYFHHCIGILMHFQHVELRDYVIIDLQWLFDNLAKLMYLSSDDILLYDYYLQEKFTNQRLLARGHNCKVQLKGINDGELNYFFKLLAHLKIIAMVTIDCVEFYYLPCVLSNLKMCDDKHKHLLSEPLLIQFTSGFLPRGFFCSLVVHLLQKPPEGWEHQLHKTTKNYSDLMIFFTR